jgi:hypothetical protein
MPERNVTVKQKWELKIRIREAYGGKGGEEGPGSGDVEGSGSGLWGRGQYAMP